MVVTAQANAASYMAGDLPRKEDKPLESIDGVDSYYGVADMSDGTRLRTIVSVPEGSEGRLPALFFTQWVSCGSIEYREGSSSREILARLARESGYALIRVERSGDGDSTGPGCDKLDYDTEFNHYLEAYQATMQHPRVDPETIVVHGSSLGTLTAILIARAAQDLGYDIDGVMVQGGGGVSYLERMTNFERIYLERRPDVDPASILGEIHDRIKFQHEYLVGGRMPNDIAKDSEAMARVRGDILGMGENDHYGRPYEWHQQLAQRNVLGALAGLDAKLLVIFNEYDQFETRHGHKMIVDMANRWRPGSATYVEQASIGHSQGLFESRDQAYAEVVGGLTTEMHSVHNLFSGILLDWLAKQSFD